MHLQLAVRRLDVDGVIARFIGGIDESPQRVYHPAIFRIGQMLHADGPLVVVHPDGICRGIRVKKRGDVAVNFAVYFSWFCSSVPVKEDDRVAACLA